MGGNVGRAARGVCGGSFAGHRQFDLRCTVSTCVWNYVAHCAACGWCGRDVLHRHGAPATSGTTAARAAPRQNRDWHPSLPGYCDPAVPGRHRLRQHHGIARIPSGVAATRRGGNQPGWIAVAGASRAAHRPRLDRAAQIGRPVSSVGATARSWHGLHGGAAGRRADGRRISGRSRCRGKRSAPSRLCTT